MMKHLGCLFVEAISLLGLIAKPGWSKKRPQLNAKPESISLMTTEELAELPEWLIPPSKKEEVERFKTRAKR